MGRLYIDKLSRIEEKQNEYVKFDVCLFVLLRYICCFYSDIKMITQY